jgi:hypothetical protein
MEEGGRSSCEKHRRGTEKEGEKKTMNLGSENPENPT